MMTNYMLQDIVGSLLAVGLFPIVFLIPGYVIGWTLNVFEFRSRRLIAKHIIGVVLSNALAPVLLFLVFRFTSASIVLAGLFLLGLIYIALLILEIRQNRVQTFESSPVNRWFQRTIFISSAAIILLIIASLVDIQIGDRLYFTSVSNDLTTRVAVVDSISRTGVPPVNPGYYPGAPVRLTYLYYFWYIPGSIVDILGGDWVSPYQSMLASIAWCCLIILAVTAIYLRLRNRPPENDPRRMSWIASQLFLISGLDFIPVLILMISVRLTTTHSFSNGQIEDWNIPIMSWLNAVRWVPNHVSAACACIFGMLVILEVRKGGSNRLLSAMLAGLAFASALGLSVWLALTFAVFWVVWMFILFLHKDNRGMLPPMLATGVVAILAASPFLYDMFAAGGTGANAALPIAFYIRPFSGVMLFNVQTRMQYLLNNLTLLPINYLFELGFFFLVGILWIRTRIKRNQALDPFTVAELTLLGVVLFLTTFFYSTLIVINDFGVRAWLPGQFVLLVWAADILAPIQQEHTLIRTSLFDRLSLSGKLPGVLRVFFIVGLLTSILEIAATRLWPMLVDVNIVGFPNDLSPDTHLGKRTFAARQAYDFIRENVEEELIIQNNPKTSLDRPGGLYGNHQFAVADRTAYGVPPEELKRLIDGVGRIFNSRDIPTWESVDEVCEQYSIDIIIVNDTDPLWAARDRLRSKRPPLFENSYYAIFPCGQ